MDMEKRNGDTKSGKSLHVDCCEHFPVGLLTFLYSWEIPAIPKTSKKLTSSEKPGLQRILWYKKKYLALPKLMILNKKNKNKHLENYDLFASSTGNFEKHDYISAPTATATRHVYILGHQNPLVNEFYAVQKHRSTDFEALNSGNVR